MTIRAALMRPALTLSALTLALLLPGTAIAQQQPLTGKMLNGYQPHAVAPPVATRDPAPPAPVTPHPVAAPATAAVTTPLQTRTAEAPATTAAATAPAAAAPPQPDPQPMPAWTNNNDIPAQSSYTAPSFSSAGIGDTTRELLRMQASGNHAGKPLPMLGDEASASYRRYIDSFTHPIPEFFDTTVDKDSGGSR